MVEKLYVTYNEVHKLCQESAEKILREFKPDLMIAIGGGGYVPARILRTFLKKAGSNNIPIQAIGLSLYETLPSTSSASAPEAPGTQVTRTQWLDFSSLSLTNLIGKSVLIVDEVDDTRTTLDYAVRELTKDVEAARKREAVGKEGMEGGEAGGETRFSIFVLHNKNKEKKGNLPAEMFTGAGGRRYLAAREVGDVWINYPWEATDIEEHDRMASKQREK